MRRTEVLQGVRMMKFRDVFGRCAEGGLSQLEAAGDAAFWAGGGGKPSAKRVPAAQAEEVERLYRERYAGFTAKHFHEHLVKSHGFGWGYTWTKTYPPDRGYLPQ